MGRDLFPFRLGMYALCFVALREMFWKLLLPWLTRWDSLLKQDLSRYLCPVVTRVGGLLALTVTLVLRTSAFLYFQLIPDVMEFKSGDIPNYTTSDGSVKILKESEVRLKLIGTRVDATFCIGTMKDDFLGVVSIQTHPHETRCYWGSQFVICIHLYIHRYSIV